MNLRSLVVVVLRLLSLNFLLQVAVTLTPQLLQFSRSYRELPSEFWLAVLPWVVLGSMIACAVLLWILALPIARLVTRGVAQDISFGAMSLVDCYSIAFMAVGLLYIAGHLPQVLNWTFYLFKAAASRSGTEWRQEVNGYAVSQAYIPFIVGVILFVKGRSWAVTLARKQETAEASGGPTPGSHPQ